MRRFLLIFIRAWAACGIWTMVLFTKSPPPLVLVALALIMVSAHLIDPREPARARVAVEVEDDRKLVEDIVQQYVGDPPRFAGSIDQAELERQIEARFAGWEVTERGIQPKVEPVRPDPDELERVGTFGWPKPFVSKAQMAGVKKIVAAFEAGAIDHAECEALLSTYLGKGVKVARLKPITSVEDVPMFPCPDMEYEPDSGLRL